MILNSAGERGDDSEQCRGGIMRMILQPEILVLMYSSPAYWNGPTVLAVVICGESATLSIGFLVA